MQHNIYTDSYLIDILYNIRSIIFVGASNKIDRPSYHVMQFMQEKGYHIVPVNPGLSGQKILGETVVSSLLTVQVPCQMVDIFRSSEATKEIVDEAITVAYDRGISVIWMQLNVLNNLAATKAKAAGLRVVMNRCPKIELERIIKSNSVAL